MTRHERRIVAQLLEATAGLEAEEALVRLLDVLKDYSVQCFFSYETGDKTTFNNMATEGIEKYEDRCSSLIGKAYSEFAIPVVPNFTDSAKEQVRRDTRQQNACHGYKRCGTVKGEKRIS